jgi:predicted nucleic acid-binding protein
MIYVDTSAAIKLVIEEDESAELERWLRAQQDDSLVTSDLTRIELVRSVIRRNPLAVPQAVNLLGGFDLLRIDDRVIIAAQSLPDSPLRTLDAIHLASALRIRASLTTMLAYDKRLLAAATAHGLPTESPGGTED